MAFTFFFRDLTPLSLAVKHLVESAMGRSRIRVWDAGCAMGQEPYTLAILLAEGMGAFAYRNLEIFATDYDRPLLKTLEEGVYPGEELQRIPRELFEKYFDPFGENGHFRVAERVRARVQTRHHDLLSLVPVRDGFSLVVCKNVLLHFQYGERVEVIRMFHKALESGGFLVMEHTQKLPPEAARLFEQVVPDAQLFRKIEA